MKGVILVGGFGTRLRPLTLTRPKPLVPFANKPIIKHQIEALAAAGITEVILAVGYMEEQLTEALKGYAKEIGIKIIFSVEEIAMGTAGPLSLVKEMLVHEKEPFFVLNSDVICNFPFKEMIEHHRVHGSDATILATTVEEPSKYGVIITDASARITAFIEKPQEFVGNSINAGIYLFNTTIFEYIENRPMSIEKEVLIQMVVEKKVCTFGLLGFWMDIGQPKDYILGHRLFLQSLSDPNARHSLIDPTAKISPTAQIGKNTVIGKNVVIEAGVKLEGSIIFEGSIIQENAQITNSIIGWDSVVSRWSRIEGLSVLGANVQVNEGIYISGGAIPPNTDVAGHVVIQPPSTPKSMAATISSPSL
ncbi:mannose-1-phosphate guanylyltransferase [Nematocida displodere]|uniref:mannose-1-phosphate guanylyltransferase n=1 Tax=Nematocida displodere TaxID=1805483 RepID=A0A177EAM2_9MICR|nr:mannose-1-phosphate guanylyltransferase [Nematocida displodere]